MVHWVIPTHTCLMFLSIFLLYILSGLNIASKYCWYLISCKCHSLRVLSIPLSSLSLSLSLDITVHINWLKPVQTGKLLKISLLTELNSNFSNQAHSQLMMFRVSRQHAVVVFVVGFVNMAQRDTIEQ